MPSQAIVIEHGTQLLKITLPSSWDSAAESTKRKVLRAAVKAANAKRAAGTPALIPDRCRHLDLPLIDRS